MKITQLRINGIDRPLGYALDTVICSWKVEDAVSRRQTYAKIVVSTDELFEQVVYKKEGRDLSCIGECLEYEWSPCTRYYYYVEVCGEQTECAQSDVSWFETGKMNQAWSADAITTKAADTYHPEFYKKFEIEHPVVSARLYICGLGVYEAYINGKKAGDEYLAPYTSDYHEKIQYQTYDVTELLAEGNELSVICGNGWYKGRLGYEGHSAVYGDRFLVIAELHLTYADGTHEVIDTNESWSYRGSDIADSDLYDGEIFDRTLWAKKENPFCAVEKIPFDTKKLVDRESLPIKAHETLQVQTVIQTPAGETVLDFGQNCAGYVEFDAELSAGSRIVLSYGEIMQEGCFYNENYRTAKAEFTYVSDGRKELVRPHFTYYGFRYVRVSGWVGELDAKQFRARVLYSDLNVTGQLETSDANINRLFLNCMWGQKSNFMDLPTDCPQRDERLGWTGDAQVFAPTASFHMDTRAFYAKYLNDLRLEQKKWGGAVPNYIPNYTNSPGGAAV